VKPKTDKALGYGKDLDFEGRSAFVAVRAVYSMGSMDRCIHLWKYNPLSSEMFF
jgi:hypothetical protein